MKEIKSNFSEIDILIEDLKSQGIDDEDISQKIQDMFSLDKKYVDSLIKENKMNKKTSGINWIKISALGNKYIIIDNNYKYKIYDTTKEAYEFAFLQKNKLVKDISELALKYSNGKVYKKFNNEKALDSFIQMNGKEVATDADEYIFFGNTDDIEDKWNDILYFSVGEGSDTILNKPNPRWANLISKILDELGIEHPSISEWKNRKR